MSKVTIHPYIIDTLMRDLVGHFKKPSAFVVFLFVWFQTVGQKKPSALLSLSQIAYGTGLSKSAVQIVIRYLKHRKLLSVEKTTVTATPRYVVAEPWDRT